MRTLDLIPSESTARFVRVAIPVLIGYVLLRAAGMATLFGSDAEGIGVLLQIIGTLYSVLYAFATYVIWGQYAAVESEILKESGALKDLVLFSEGMGVAVRDQLLQAVRVYARAIGESEWPQLAAGEPTEKTDRLFSELIATLAAFKPGNATEGTVYERLLGIMNDASAHRDERIALSVKRVPHTLILLVTLSALLLLVLLIVYPFHSSALGMASLAVTGMVLFLAHLVITDLDNPFAGIWNVSPLAFERIVQQARRAAHG